MPLTGAIRSSVKLCIPPTYPAWLGSQTQRVKPRQFR